LAAVELTFPLVPRRRLVGLAFGALHSARRGMGSDVAGSRPYHPGDDVDTIDWHASAKLSAARSADEFIVRERYAEEAPRVAVLCDRRPEMALYPEPLPWLSKPQALQVAVELILDSTAAARGLAGYLEHRGDEPFWRPPRSEHRSPEIRERLESTEFTAAPDTIEAGLEYLTQHRRSLPAGSFVFVCSDFLSPPPPEAWLLALDQLWDVVCVVVQDPVWEQSFPDVAGLVLPLVDPRTGRLHPVRLTAREVAERRAANELRLRELVVDLGSSGIETIVVSSAERAATHAAFLAWADTRAHPQGERW
jgi:uncharacterized protein (DUF58 family)